MTKVEINLVEFLAWVEDNFTWISDDEYIGVGNDGHYTREQIVEQYSNRLV